MADFLAKLAARTLGLEPVAQPLIAPMYAPGPELLSNLDDRPTEQEMEDAADGFSLVPLMPSTPLVVPPPGRLDADFPPPESRPHARHHMEAGAYGFADQQADGEGSTPQQNLPVQSTGRRGDQQRIEPAGPPERLHLPQDPSAPRPSEQAGAALPQYGAGLLSGRHETSALLVPIEPPAIQPPVRWGGSALTHNPAGDGPVGMAAPEEDAVEPGIMPRQPAGGRPPDRQPLAPTEFSGLEPAPLTPAQPEPPSPEAGSYRPTGDEPGEPPGPVIHISIGRVEVRAVMQAPPPPSPPTSPLPPPLSLDEYLRSQNGGR